MSTVYTGEGSFIDSDTVRVHTEERRGSFIAIGSHLYQYRGRNGNSSFGGNSRNPYVYTSTSLMELADLPRRLVIVGEDMWGWNLRLCMLRSVRRYLFWKVILS